MPVSGGAAAAAACRRQRDLDFLIEYVEKFDMYVEDDYAAFVRYCFADPLDAEISARASSRRGSASSSQGEP